MSTRRSLFQCDRATRSFRALKSLSILSVPLLLTGFAGATGTSRFLPMPVDPSGGMAKYTLTADVNGDGRPDVIVSNANGAIAVLLGKGNGSFVSPKIVATVAGGAPSIAVGDFNGDGQPDLAIVSATQNRIEIFLGHGDGSFGPPHTFATGAGPSRVAAGYVNGDGALDLVVTVQAGFSVLLGNGNGSFRHPVDTVATYGASGLLALGDLNRDGHLDVVTSDQRGNDEVFLGIGDGKFREQIQPIPDKTVDESQLLLADLNGDGKLDLVVGNFGPEIFANPSKGIAILWGNGDGTFQTDAVTLLLAGYDPVSLVAEDLNGDGRLDLAAANILSNSVSVLLNRGAGKFAPTVNYSTRYLPSSNYYDPLPGLLTAGDFNADGRPDLALATGDGIQLLMNTGGGRLHAPASIEVRNDLISAAALDLNGDGRLDIAVEVGGDLCCNSGGSLLALLGNGKGEFSLVPTAGVDDTLGSPLAGADFNHDGRPDLAVLGFYAPAVYTILNAGHNTFTRGPTLLVQSGVTVIAGGDFNNDGYGDLALLNGNEVDIYLGNGIGFRGPVTSKVGANPVAMVVRDLDGDGRRDLIIANHDSNDVSILLGRGDGSFEPARTFPAGKKPTSLAIGDFNRDGKLDLAVGGDTMQILLGRGKGEFSPPVSYPAPGPISFVAVADLRGNGLEDLLTASGGRFNRNITNSIAVFYGKGNGAFDPPTPYSAGFNPGWFAVGDFNSDGATDVAVVDSGGTALTLLLNQGGTRVALRSSSTSAKAGTLVTFTATVASGAPGAGVPRGTLAFKDGSRAIGIVHLNDGRAVFSTAHLSKGKHTITASYWGDGFFNPHISSPVIEMIAP